MSDNSVKTVKIKKIIKECKDVKTLTFSLNEHKSDFETPKPGQFIMVWVPGVDEIPISLSYYDDNGNWSITVKNVGECTKALFNLIIGDYIGIRGPFGNGYDLPTEKNGEIFLIAGGIGFAPLKSLILELEKKEVAFNLITGAKMKNQMMFTEFCESLGNECTNTYYCTDDGSQGIKGLTTEVFEELINTYSKDKLKKLLIYACGPEKMLYTLFQICEKYGIELQVSLERIMRCGCGLCGLCVMDPTGILVCKDGPVFSSKSLREMEDFGKYKRDFTGRKISI